MLRELLQHPQTILLFLLFVGPTLVSIWKKHRQGQQGPPKRTPPSGGPMPGESDLERRVRENFEEILRRRRGESSGTDPDAGPAPRDAGAPARPAPASARAPSPPPSRPTPTAIAGAHRRPPPAPAARTFAPGQAPLPPVPDNPYLVATTSSSNANAYVINTDRAYDVNVDAYSLERKPSRRKSAGRLIRRRELDHDSLRRAVLWKEILDAPLGMRRPRDEQF